MRGGAGGGGWPRLAIVATAVAVALAALGWVPTRRLAGEGGTTAMLLALGINLAASLVAGLPVARAARRRGEGGEGRAAARDAAARGLAAVLGATAVRFVAVSAATVAAALLGAAPTAPLLVWAAAGYLALLVVDTGWALATLGGGMGGTEMDGTVTRGTETR